MSALTDYSEDQIQGLIAQLPTERIVTFQSGMNKIQIENKYLEAFCDRDLAKVASAEEKAVLFEKRANLKVQLREASPEDKPTIQIEFDKITKQIEEAS